LDAGGRAAGGAGAGLGARHLGPLGLGGPLATSRHPGHEPAGGRGELQPFGLQELSCQFLLGRLICLGRRRTSAAELADQRHRQNGDDERGQDCSLAHEGLLPVRDELRQQPRTPQKG
jgi:hypothetical protein